MLLLIGTFADEKYGRILPIGQPPRHTISRHQQSM